MLMDPIFIYGTAWKQDSTKDLTKKAVLAGFRAIDTANQKKHYREDFVGEALLELAKSGIKRADLFLQSKFTSVHGQDHRLPYDPSDDFLTQVESSFANTLRNLHTDYIDSYLLHGPSTGGLLQKEDWEVWSAIEKIFESKQVKSIGVSNVTLNQLKEFCLGAKIKPMTVQNRCYANRGWDQDVREYCLKNGIIYQGFSILTANRQVLVDNRLRAISVRFKKTPEQIVFRFARQIGMIPITGTSDERHMKEDLAIQDFELSASEMSLVSSMR